MAQKFHIEYVDDIDGTRPHWGRHFETHVLGRSS